MHRFINIQKIKFLTTVFVLIISVFAVSGCNDEDKDGSDHSFTYTIYKNPQNLDPQLACDKSSLMIIQNMFLGLMTFNIEGKLDYGVATSCEITDDGKKYHFYLRDDCYWYSADGAEDVVTAHDFVYAFKRIYNPVTISPYTEKFSFIKNAESIMNGETEYTQLGVYAINATELVFELDRPNSEFMYLLTTAPAMPCNKQFFEGTKARYGLDDESVISNGAFYMTQWSYDPYGNDNLIYMKRNYNNTKYDEVYPYMLKFIIEKQKEVASENFDSGYTDCFVSDDEYKKSLLGTSETNRYQSTSVGIIFNDKYKIDSDIKRALSFSIDREKYKSIITSNFSMAYGIIPGSIYIGDTNYRDSIDDSKMPFYSDKYDLTKSQKDDFYNTFSDNAKIMIRSKSDNGFMNQIIDDWHDSLDIYIGIDYVDDAEYYQRLQDGDYGMALTEMTIDDNSIYYFLKNVIDSINSTSDNYNKFTNILEGSLVNTSDSEKIKSYSEIENEILMSGDYIPVFYKNKFVVYKKGISDFIFNPFSEQINFRYAKYFD